MAKKVVWIIVVVALWCLVYKVDKMRIVKKQKPWFCFPVKISENTKGYYYGLGYKAYIDTIKNQKGKEEITSIKLGHWFEDLK